MAGYYVQSDLMCLGDVKGFHVGSIAASQCRLALQRDALDKDHTLTIPGVHMPLKRWVGVVKRPSVRPTT